MALKFLSSCSHLVPSAFKGYVILTFPSRAVGGRSEIRVPLWPLQEAGFPLLFGRVGVLSRSGGDDISSG